MALLEIHREVKSPEETDAYLQQLDERFARMLADATGRKVRRLSRKRLERSGGSALKHPTKLLKQY